MSDADNKDLQPNDVPLVGSENITDPNTGNRAPIVVDWQKMVVAGDVVQLSPEHTGNRAFAGCFMVVTDVYSWGVQGYVPDLGKSQNEEGGLAYYRAEWATVEPTGGKAVWLAEGPE